MISVKTDEPLRLLITLLADKHPGVSTRSCLLVKATMWYEEIKSMFSYLGVPDEYLDKYADDYIIRLYMLKIKDIIIYFYKSFFSFP
jgi:hypothetical protein